jgi:hypothetical protein
MKVTVPVGLAVPVNAGATAAVKTTVWLTLELEGNEVRVVVVVDALTVSDNKFDVALLKFEFELVKAAETLWTPKVAKEAAQAGTVPLTLSVTLQSVVLVVVSL